MSDKLTDIGRAIARLRDRLEDQEERNQPPEQIALTETVSEEVGCDETVTVTSKTGNNRIFKFDDANTPLDFSELSE